MPEPSAAPVAGRRRSRGWQDEGSRRERGSWLGGEEWGIVMSSSTVTNDRTEFANCDRTQLLPKGCVTHPGGNVSSVAGQFCLTQGRISVPFSLIVYFFQNNNLLKSLCANALPNSFYPNDHCHKKTSSLIGFMYTFFFFICLKYYVAKHLE